MKPERLVETYKAIRAALPADAAGEAAEPPVEPNELGARKEVVRALSRLGVIRSSRVGPAARREAEAAAWTLAERTQQSVREVASALAAFALQGPCGETPRCDACPAAALCRRRAARGRARPTIKDLPRHERPRERLLGLGPDALTDAELLAIILGGGRRDASAIDLAQSLLARAGGFRRLAELSAAELMELSGVGEAKAARVLAALAIARRYAAARLERGAALSSSLAVFDHFRRALDGEKRETFICVFLDAKNRYLGEERVSVGTLVASPVSPREVFRAAIRAAAKSVIFVHNHPSGDPAPSPDDLSITRRLAEVGRTVGISVLDHVILGDDEYYSFADKGLL